METPTQAHFLCRVLRMAISRNPKTGTSTAANIGANQPEPGSRNEATCPLPEVFTVMVTTPAWVRDDGVKETVVLAGKPATLKVADPGDGLVPKLTWNEYVAELPAVTVTLEFEVGLISIGRMIVGSDAVLLA